MARDGGNGTSPRAQVSLPKGSNRSQNRGCLVLAIAMMGGALVAVSGVIEAVRVMF